MKKLIALLCGFIFGTGLLMSGMANPDKVLNFLNLTLISSGEWDPSLMFVMVGAIGVYLPCYLLIVKPRAKAKLSPVLASQYHLPTKTTLDAPLVIGSILFGLGWGVVGICPGPGIVNLSNGDWHVALFVLAMLLGSFIAHRLKTAMFATKAVQA
ncbi:YeeE/YedE family protein [Shewanella sp. AS1]|uniref:YeeE/YedE family protein n=1 Tax=Shewanella sp. AS1 TaxID=2907626 RepID=UPI001F36142F|nr:YeeE/YedE family protein [Shewanella sp. AS1]MCE9677731.1 YeeE/YedE family protein [Shewanella sp. AS1]